MINNNIVGIIGTGSVGSAVGYGIINQGLCDSVIMVDKNRDRAEAEATDLENCIEYLNRNMRVYAGDFKDLKNADIIVMTAAAPYIEGQNRLDMFDGSKQIVQSVIPEVMKHGFNGQFIVITNPVDVMSYFVYRLSGLPKNKIIGTGTALDSARLKNLLSELIEVDPRSINAFTMGEHGDSQMIPWSAVRAGGKPFEDIVRDNPDKLSREQLSGLLTKVVNMGWEIMRSKGSTNYGIASSTVGIIKAIMHDENKIIPVSAMLEGEYGANGVFAGVPAIINRDGVKDIVEIQLSASEKQQLDKSFAVLKEYIGKL